MQEQLCKDVGGEDISGRYSQLKLRRTGVVVWDCKGGEAIYMEMENQMFGK